MRTLSLPSGRTIPVLGQGTWKMGEHRALRPAEIAALRLGLDLGITLIDTAEMYGDGGAEEVVGEAIVGRRNEVFLVSKVLPHHGSLKGAIAACDRSLRRLKTDYIDLYLLHWRGSIPLAETLEAFQSLKISGKIMDYGLSNFDIDEMVEASGIKGTDKIATDQVLYNLLHRGIEWDLLPWCRENGMPVMAYSPIEHSPGEQRYLLDHPGLKSIAIKHRVTPAQVALGWLLHQPAVVAIPKATSAQHLRENVATLNLVLNRHDLEVLNQAFPPPHKKIPLEMR